MSQLFILIGNMLRRYTPGQRMVIIVVFIGIISSIISLVMWANRPEYDVLYTNLDPTAAGEIVSELRGSKVSFKLENNGRNILVPMENVSELRLKFAEKGYAGQIVSGYEIFDNAKIGMTTFMQQLNMRRALEGELTKTINQFPGIKNSRVHLVIPEERLFEENKKGSASVVLYLNPGRYLSEDQVKGITALVSNSVKAILPQNVVVVDSDGNLLSSNQNEDGALTSAGSQWELQHTIETKLQNKVTDIVEGIVGYHNAVVKVSVDLNFEQIEKTMEMYDPENVVIVSEERHTESSTNLDTSENINENYLNENVITNYELNKTIEHFVSNTGTIERISVAVLVNGTYKISQGGNGEEIKEYNPRSKKDLTQIVALVKSSVGYNEDRGDIVEVQNLQFDKSSIAIDKEYFSEAENQFMWADIINKSIMGIGILFAFFLVRTLLKSAGTIMQLPAVPNTMLTPAEIGGSTGGTQRQLAAEEEDEELSEDLYIKKLSPEARAKLKAKDKMTSDVVNYAKESPEDAARLIRSWLTQPNK